MKSPWLLRVLALAGLAVSIILLVEKFTTDPVIGCGAESGCGKVLKSQWSQFFYIPVSAFSAVAYVVLLGATWKPSRPLYLAFAICLTGAALWFFGVLLFELKEFCPWCTTAHVIGLTSSVVLVLSSRKMEPSGESLLRLAPPAAVLALIVFCLGQTFGPSPQTHAEESGVTINESGQPANGGEKASGSASGRMVSLPNSNKAYHTGFMPHLGPADAPHVVVKYFDYTCGSCRDMHDDLKLVEKMFPGKICMIMLPVPLNRDCNPHFPKPQANHEHACELARLGLAAWRAKPEAFAEVHEQLFTRPILEPEIAEIAVGQIVGAEALEKALEDPWVEQTLQADISDFEQLIKQRLAMPKLLIVEKGRLIHGLTKNANELIGVLAKDFGLTLKR